MYYLSIINDIQFGDKVIKVKKIVDLLFENKIWVYTSHAPHVKKLSKGDKFILYLAGDGRRYFYGSFDIETEYDEIPSNKFLGARYNNILKIFKYYTSIKNIKVFNTPLKINEIKENLNFITDKKNYGLFLRQSVKMINEQDYNYILNHIK